MSRVAIETSLRPYDCVHLGKCSHPVVMTVCTQNISFTSDCQTMIFSLNGEVDKYYIHLLSVYAKAATEYRSSRLER